MKTPTHTAPPVALDRLVLPLDVPWIVVDGDYDSLDIHDAKGGFICSPCGDTLGEVCDRSSLIAAAPELLKRCRELESALHRLLTADIPRPLGGIIDETERQAAIEWNAFERGEARQHARAILRQNADVEARHPDAPHQQDGF